MSEWQAARLFLGLSDTIGWTCSLLNELRKNNRSGWCFRLAVVLLAGRLGSTTGEQFM